jgi:hypothetical protein
MTKTLPIETQNIFEILTKGHFISEDSEISEIKELYKVIDENNNYELLLDYFSHIGFQLIKGNSYYYFAKNENNKKIEDKLKSLYKWIDIINFFMSYGESMNEHFSNGKIFTPNEIFTQCKVNNALLEKLNDIKLTKSIEKPLDKIIRLIEELKKATFVDVYNDFHDEYKVLASFNYLEQLINTIDINIDDEDTTSE